MMTSDGSNQKLVHQRETYKIGRTKLIDLIAKTEISSQDKNSKLITKISRTERMLPKLLSMRQDKPRLLLRIKLLFLRTWSLPLTTRISLLKSKPRSNNSDLISSMPKSPSKSHKLLSIKLLKRTLSFRKRELKIWHKLPRNKHSLMLNPTSNTWK